MVAELGPDAVAETGAGEAPVREVIKYAFVMLRHLTRMNLRHSTKGCAACA